MIARTIPCIYTETAAQRTAAVSRLSERDARRGDGEAGADGETDSGGPTGTEQQAADAGETERRRQETSLL